MTKGTIEVPVELVAKLRSFCGGAIYAPEIVPLLEKLPRPDPALDPCPFCGAECKALDAYGQNQVHCDDTCGYRGPYNDPAGEQHNKVARAARGEREILKKMRERIEEGFFDSISEILCYVREVTK